MKMESSVRESSNNLFEEKIVPEVDLLYRSALSLTRSHADAQDLVQDTLLRAYRAINRFDGRYPRAWLLTIMRNANINRVRKKRPELLDDETATFERSLRFADHDTPDAALVKPLFEPAVEEALGSLPDGFRDAVELVDLNGLSYQEAATLLEVPVGTVMSRLHRARNRVREHIEAAGGYSHE